MTGTLVYVMGPSGVGKDSLLAYARRSMSAAYAQTWTAPAPARQGLRPVLFARRYITRAADAGGERHHAVTREAFQHLEDQGAFALSWESHGLRYGIGSEVDATLAAGAVVVINGSREYLPVAAKKYPKLAPVLISARPEVLRERLQQRGREAPEHIDERLAGAGMKLPGAMTNDLIRLDNSGPLEETGEAFARLLLRLRQRPAPAGAAERRPFMEAPHLWRKPVSAGLQGVPAMA